MSGADRARMAKSADAADLKSAGRKRLWEFKSPSGHHFKPLGTRLFRFGTSILVSQSPQHPNHCGWSLTGLRNQT
jgi:hypothetical protein